MKWIDSTDLRSWANRRDCQETLVLTTHGIIKKTDKTPEKEIEKAEQIRLKYFKLKEGYKNGNKK
jgi:phage-related protein